MNTKKKPAIDKKSIPSNMPKESDDGWTAEPLKTRMLGRKEVKK